MLQPSQIRASMEKVLETMYVIRDAQVKEFIADRRTENRDYGLDAPQIRVVIRMEDGGSEHRLVVGAKDRTRRGYFASVNASEAVFLVEEALVNALLADASVWEE